MSQNLTIKIDWEVPQKVIFNALLEPMEVMKYTRGPAIVERKVGGAYNIYDGKITGEFLEIDEEKYIIKLNWKFREWNQFSQVTFTFKDKEDECQMTMTQTDIPASADLSQLEKGWHAQVFKAISVICGYGIEE